MGNCRSKKRNSPIDRLGQDYPNYDQSYAGTSGLGQQFGLGGFGGDQRSMACFVDLSSLFAAGGSGYGQGAGGYGFESSCPEGVNQNTALLATGAAIAVGAGVIFRAVTLQQAGRRRREAGVGPGEWGERLRDLVMMGERGEEESSVMTIVLQVWRMSRKELTDKEVESGWIFFNSSTI